jgi:hypothetical protein
MRHDCTREIEAATAPLLAEIERLHKAVDEQFKRTRLLDEYRAEIAELRNGSQMPRRRVVLAGDGDLGNFRTTPAPEREAASAARIWPIADSGVDG